MAFLGGEGQDGLARCRVLMDLGDHGGALAHGGRNALDRPGAHIAWGSTSTQGKRVTRLCEIEAEKKKAKALLDQLEAEEQGLIEAEATKSHGAILSTIAKFGAHYTLKQRKDIATALGLKATVSGKPSEATRSAGGEVPPKFQIPSGEHWTGRGQMKKEFGLWEKSAEGKAWRKAHPGEKWPAYPYKA